MSTGLRKGGFHFKRKTCRLYSVLRYFEKLFLNVHWFRKNRILIKVHCCSFLMEDTARINSKLQERSKTWHADPIAVGVVVTCCSLDQEWSLALHGVTWWVLLRYVSSQSEKAAPLRHPFYLTRVSVIPGWMPREKKLIYNMFSESWVDIHVHTCTILMPTCSFVSDNPRRKALPNMAQMLGAATRDWK